ncbi:hypothetical protein JCM19237_543 [Photobacterium aphoticum]|uniref:Uncharacterized protein n=1 Tax=Photobacterium aphoticum TaxID=754436 RepID=A0A090QT67_9GAMM|nr:hypothetical protein JCM19237_543 [Photobacterium aphoticum]
MTQAPPHLPLPSCLRHYFEAVLSLPPLLHSTHDTAPIADQLAERISARRRDP